MPDHPVKTTYFGVAALVAGVFCTLSLLSNYGVSQLDISRGTFGQLNNLTALLYCGSTQATVVLGVLGLTRKNDSKGLSWLGLALAVIPFLFVFGGLLISFIS
jgi:hypothetical protein